MNSFRVFWIFLFFCISVQAADGPSKNLNVRQKSDNKAKSRWTLQEWLAQKERNRMMDLWLSMSTPSPYEFFVKGSSLSYRTLEDPVNNVEETHQSISGSIGAYASLVGLEGEYENNTQESYHDLAGSLNIRVMGNAVQGTHLILRYGLRTRDGKINGTSARLAHQFGGADLNLYLTRYFGVQGVYHHYLPVDDATLGKVSGTRSEAGVFIDFEMVRLFGNWFSDKEIFELSGTRSTRERTGIQAGLKLFF